MRLPVLTRARLIAGGVIVGVIAALAVAELYAQSVTAVISNLQASNYLFTDGTVGLKVAVTSADGTLTTSQYAEDTASANAESLTMAGVRRCDTPSPSSATDGDRVTICSDAYGSLAIRIANGDGTYATLATDVIEDAAETAAVRGPMVLNVRRDAAAASAGTTGDNATFNSDALGLLWTRSLDPCSGVAKTYYVVDIATATTVEIANAVASQFFYICSVNLVAGAAQTVVIGEDDTDGCGSLSAGLNGGVTAAEGWSFAANGGIALGNGSSTVMKTSTANRYFCILTGQAQQVSGTIAYVSAP